MSEQYSGVLVLGMHRSGTSAVAGMLAAAGLDVGVAENLQAGDEHNPRGYFEPRRVVQLDDELMSRAGGSWDDPPAAERVEAMAAEAAADARAAVAELRRGAATPWVLKDPRTTALLPIWLRALEGEALPVLVVRHPADVAMSLLRRDGQTQQASLALWEVYLARALRWLDGREVVVMPYEQVLEDADLRERVLGEISSLLGCRLDTSSAGASLDTSLRRSVASDDDLALFGTIRQRELWAYLSRLEPGRQKLNGPEALVHPSSEAVTTVAVASRQRRALDLARAEARGATSVADERAVRIGELQAQVRDLEQSIAAARSELKLVVEESGQRALRVAELEAQSELLQQVTAELATARADVAQVTAEREQLRASAAAALDRLRAVVSDTAEVRRTAEARVAELEAQTQRAEHDFRVALHELAEAKRSATWRAGRVLVAPLSAFRSRKRS